MDSRTNGQIATDAASGGNGLDDDWMSSPTPRYRHLATSAGRAGALSDVRHLAAGLISPGGAFIASGLLLPGATAFLVTNLVARFDLPVALGLWLAVCLVGVATARRPPGTAPGMLEIAAVAVVLPVLGGLLAGSAYLALAGAGQLANRCTGRAAAFFGLQAMLVLAGGSGPLLLGIAACAAVEAVTTSWLASGIETRAHQGIDDDE